MNDSTHSPESPFELDPHVYDQLVNWDKRLPREAEFLRPRFEAAGVRRVLDVACGTGRHAGMFADWGLEVVGTDVGASMIEFCRDTWGQSPALQWRVAAMEDLPPADRPFDALVCLGNSLALVADDGALRRTLAGFGRQLRPGGLLITHVLNFARLPDGPIVWQKARQVASGGRTWCLAKGVHRAGERAFVDVAEWPADTTDDTRGCRSTPLQMLTPRQLDAALAEAGFGQITHYGNQSADAFDPATSPDLITVASRRGLSGSDTA